ncbi:hypothetical protein [Phyllobacterium myrsinacearum]|uniref:Uncharacterized protein n=1 Tax=Phyllobacterium myrsinacearum TaxID=28101 RepID=A0A839EH25_9HYPH|nr:hypothetical protein [Phyllobacterium myrsinacearum]MBA8879281.1 hypothetical protein [Phyllobacterium myrsinacearum]
MFEQQGEEYSALVNKVAKELFKRRHGKAADWDNLPLFVRKNYEDDACTAIETIREVLMHPTNEMIDAANRSLPSTTSGMIIAAIKASELNAITKK